MKFKTTKNEMYNQKAYVIKVNNCKLQFLLNSFDPVTYTCGKNGWYSDIYATDYNVYISTGYRPFGNIVPGADLVKKYEDAASEIVSSTNNIIDRKKQLKSLLNSFVAECLKLMEEEKKTC